MTNSVRYQFTQQFAVPAKKAFQWCTDYEPGDHLLMGEKNAKRKVTHLTDATIILTDIFETSSGNVEKQKLVQLYPEKLAWISTHLAGPNKYSQFIYEISAKGENASSIQFTGLHLEYEKANLSKGDANSFANKLCKEDSEAWKLLAKAMKKELCT